MIEKTTDFEQIVSQALRLSPLEKIRLVERVVATVEQDVINQQKAPLPSLYGLGTAPSAEEIDEARREMWSNFPQEDI